MGLHLTCPRGHHWEPAGNGSRDTHPLCPQCGAAPLASLAPSSSPAGPQATTAPTFAPPAAVLPLPVLPGYRILGELGRGGMGVVYKAQHLALKRIVALKMVLSGAHAGSVELGRFRAEAEAVARLQHPSIVQIYEVGEHEGRPYCALEYVSGGSLAQRIGGKPLPAAAAASLVAALAEGIQHAHDHGIVHRDLKPANVLLQEPAAGKTHSGHSTVQSPGSGLLAADSCPKITDFGLAKTLDNPDGPTKTGSVLGTPSYMAPEQALGRNRTIGPPTDIYALGAILYECLTGQPPFKAETSLDTMLLVASQDPVPPRQINSAVPRDLETICLKCLRKEPGKRYASACELAEDIGRFLRKEAIRARPVGPIERVVKWARRRPALIAVGVLLLLLPVTGAIVWKVRQTGPIVSVPAGPLVINADEQMRYAQQINQADQERLEGKYNHADEILAEVAPGSRGWEWDYLHRVCNWGLRRTLTDFGGPIRQVAFGRNGRIAVVAESPGVSIRDASSGKQLIKLGERPVNAVAFSSDGKNLAVVGNDRMLRLYDAASGQEITAREHPGPLACVVFSPDGKWLAAGGGPPNQPGYVWLWNAAPGKEPVRKCGFHKNRVVSVVFASDSAWFTSMAMGGEMHGWAIAGGGEGNFAGTEYAQRLIFVPRSPAVGILAYHGLDLWWPAQQAKTSYLDPPARKPGAMQFNNVKMEQTFDDQPDPRPGSMVFDAAYSSDETMLAMVGGWQSQGKVRIYRGQPNSSQLNGSLLLFGHTQRVGTVSFSPDQPLLATGSADGTVRIWDPTIRRFDAALAAAAPSVLSGGTLTASQPRMAFSPDSQRLATVMHDPLTLALWDLNSGQKTICPRLTDKGWLQSPYFSPDGRLAAVTGEGTRTVCIWNGTTGAKVGTWADTPVGGGELSARKEGFLLASALPDQPIKGFLDKPTKGIQLSDPANGAKVRMLGAESFWLPFPILSPNGDRLAAVSKEGVLHLWDTGTGQTLLTSPGREPPRFTLDGRYLIRDLTRTAPEKPLEIWDARTGQPAGLHLPTKPLRGPFQFAPDGKLLAWPTDKGEILLWNAAAGQPVATARGHGGPVGSLVFGTDGRRLFSVSSEDATVKIWDTATGLEMCSLHHARGTQGQLLLSPDGRKLALRNTGGTFVWDATPLPPEATGGK